MIELGPFHQSLIARAELDHALAINTRDRSSPFLRYHCWASNHASDAQLAAIGFRLWHYNLRERDLQAFYGTTDGYGSYYIGAMIALVTKHAGDELGRDLLAVLRAAGEIPRGLLDELMARPRGSRAAAHQVENTPDDPTIAQRYRALDEIALVRLFDRWLAVES